MQHWLCPNSEMEEPFQKLRGKRVKAPSMIILQISVFLFGLETDMKEKRIKCEKLCRQYCTGIGYKTSFCLREKDCICMHKTVTPRYAPSYMPNIT